VSTWRRPLKSNGHFDKYTKAYLFHIILQYGYCSIAQVPAENSGQGECGSLVIKALGYKPEGRGFQTR
jgi:hypothetical protein